MRRRKENKHQQQDTESKGYDVNRVQADSTDEGRCLPTRDGSATRRTGRASCLLGGGTAAEHSKQSTS